MKNLKSVLILGCLVFTFFYGIANASNGVLPGNGSVENPYLIEDFADFQAFNNVENAQIYCVPQAHIKLMADIDLNPDLPGRKVYSEPVIRGYDYYPDPNAISDPIDFPDTDDPIIIDDPDWQPEPYKAYPSVVLHYSISSYANLDMYAFCGVFDGNNHTISNLTIDTSQSAVLNTHLGLFNQVAESAVVSNLTVTNAYMDQVSNIAGGISAVNYGLIDNCQFSGHIASGFLTHSHGGITGINCGLITNSSSDMDLFSYGVAGGICGCNTGSVLSCSSSGIIKGTESIGGIAGANGLPNSDEYYGVIENCISDADVQDVLIDYWVALDPNREDQYYINSYFMEMSGSICGANFDGSIANCFGNSMISGNKWDVYGLSYDIFDCFWNSGMPDCENEEDCLIETDEMWIGYDAARTPDTYISAGWDQSKWQFEAGELPSLLYGVYTDYDLSGITITPQTGSSFYADSVQLSVIQSFTSGIESEITAAITWEIVSGSEYYTIDNGKIVNIKDCYSVQFITCKATYTYRGTEYSDTVNLNVLPDILSQSSPVRQVDIYQYNDSVNADSVSFIIDDLGFGDSVYSFDRVRLDIVNSFGQSVPGYPRISFLDRNRSEQSVFSQDGSLNHDVANDSLTYSQGGLNLSGLTAPLYIILNYSNDSGIIKAASYAAFDEYIEFNLPDNNTDIFRDVIEYHENTPQAAYDDSAYDEFIWPEHIPDATELEISLNKYIDFGENPFTVSLQVNDSSEIDVTDHMQWSLADSEDNSWYINDGILYNNTLNSSQKVYLTGVYFDGVEEYSLTQTFYLLPDYNNIEFDIKSAKVIASKNRNKPNDRLELEIENFSYPIHEAQYTSFLSVDLSFNINLISANGMQISGFPKTIDFEQIIQNGSIQGLKFANNKDVRMSVDFQVSDILTRSDMKIVLKNLDLTGLSAPFTVQISEFFNLNAFGYAYDDYAQIKDENDTVIKYYTDVINSNKYMPALFQKNIADAYTIDRFKHIIKDKDYSDSLTVSGTFVTSDEENFDPGYLKITFGAYEDICEISKSKNGKFVFNDVVYKDVQVGDKTKKQRILKLNAVFNIKTNKYSIKIRNVNMQHSFGQNLFKFEFIDKDNVILGDANFTWVDNTNYGQNPHQEPDNTVNYYAELY